MSEPRLPQVKRALFDGMSADFGKSDKVESWIAKLANENPQIIIAIDALGTSGGILAAALVYALLDSQAEADEMNENFK